MKKSRLHHVSIGIKERGQLSLLAVIFGAIAIIIISGLVIWADLSLRSAYRVYDQRSAFSIAEAGIEYYRWHLAHDQTDFQDGTGAAGPYVHTYKDKDGNTIGQFSLIITPPDIGSTVVTIRSTGTITINPAISKTLEVKMAIPSFAKYAVVIDSAVRFGPGTEVYGQIHSNDGIRFDGLAHNIVTSAASTYNDPDHSGGDEFGVHTHISPLDPLPPQAVPERPDIFIAGRQNGVPQVDFVGITQTLSSIRTDAQANGFYASPSGVFGYEVVLYTNDTFELYQVTDLMDPPTSGCYNYLSQDGWGTWTVGTRALVGTYPFPANGLIFIEDETWVRGQIDTARLTIAAGEFPDQASTRRSISITGNVLYTNYDGSDSIALFAQKNINIGLASEDDLRIDAALLAQNGRVGRYYYRKPWWIYTRCSPYHERDTITTYGMIGSRNRYGFAYTDNTGYDIRNLIYDSSLLYSPPPSFPLTSDYYEQVLWTEVE